MTCISGKRPSGNDMENISNYCTFNCGARTGFWWIYTFCINVHDWSYMTYSDNQTLGKSGWCTNYATQTDNWHKTFSLKPTCFIMCICCTQGNCTCWHKVVKHALSTTKRFWWHLRWNSTASNGYLIYVPSTQKIISSHDILFDENVSGSLAYTSRPYLKAITMQPEVLYITYAT